MRHNLSTTTGIASGVVALLGPVWLQGQAATPGLAGVFDAAAASVVPSAASAGIVSFGGGRAASNEDRPQ